VNLPFDLNKLPRSSGFKPRTVAGDHFANAAALVVHPLNEGDIWQDRDPGAA
jgi:hypothetical protein